MMPGDALGVSDELWAAQQRRQESQDRAECRLASTESHEHANPDHGQPRAAETLTEPKTGDWHYVGFGITHPGLREDCEPCTTARDMAVDAWNDPYWWGTPGWTAMEGQQ